MKIIVDAFGGDNAPSEIIKGCKMASDEYGIEIILVGNEKKIIDSAKEINVKLSDFDIIDATDIIAMDDEPTEIMKSKKESSMGVGLKSLSENKADAFVSAGNSGALVVGATMIVKRIRGISRCAFAPVIPKKNGYFMLIDSGANSDCRPEMLRQFGIMGSIYMSQVMGINNPCVALANVGVESHKGDLLRKESYKLLENSDINFVGNIEARDIPSSDAHVVVADGFTGNIILKLYEGMGHLIFEKFKNLFSKNIKTKIAAGMILSDLKALKNEIDYNQYGGAPLMGTSKPVFKAHGSSSALTIKNAIRLTKNYVDTNAIDKISGAITKIKEKEE